MIVDSRQNSFLISNHHSPLPSFSAACTFCLPLALHVYEQQAGTGEAEQAQDKEAT